MPTPSYDPSDQTRQKLVSFLYRQRLTTQKEMKEQLACSRTTLLPVLKTLEEEGVLIRTQRLASTGGRPALALQFNPLACIAVGVELLAQHFEVLVLDAYGQTLVHKVVHTAYSNHESYPTEVCQTVLDLLAEYPNIPVLGVGIVLQGLISTDGTEVTYGKILQCTGLTIDAFARHLPHPCLFFHDAEAATINELWHAPSIQNAIFVHLRSNVSGAIVVGRASLQGAELKSGVFEHMTLVPEGKPCYCGNQGCMDTYCSTTALLEPNETLAQFFDALRRGSVAHLCRWHPYLAYLARAINNLHMFIDCTVILGGTLAPYLLPEDIDCLHHYIHAHTAFPTNRRFIVPSACPHSPIARGAALWFLKRYLKDLLGEDIDTSPVKETPHEA